VTDGDTHPDHVDAIFADLKRHFHENGAWTADDNYDGDAQ
jgi:acyl dehydratase